MIAPTVSLNLPFLLAIGYKPEDKGEPVKVAVHTSCAARREMNVHVSGWQLIDGMENVERIVHDHESECCGFGGTFSVKQADISGAMVTDKVAALKETGATEIISADCGCMMNIGGKIAKRRNPKYATSRNILHLSCWNVPEIKHERARKYFSEIEKADALPMEEPPVSIIT